MFALLNPPKGKKRRKGKAAKKRRAKKHATIFSSIFTPGGGVIRKVRARNPFLGINPKFNRFKAATLKGASVMAKRKSRRNGSSLASPKQKGIFDALRPKNLVGVSPILAGVVLNGLGTEALSNKIPYTKKGIGNIALGLGVSGLLGMLGRYANKQLGDGIFIGGVVGTLGCAFQRFMAPGGGFKSLSLSGDNYLDGWANEQFGGNLGTFVSPEQISHAFSSQSPIAQYSLPNTNAQFMRLAPPQTPMQAQQARGVSDIEQGNAIGAVLGNEEDISGIM